ncbi:hypothetical protein R1flu_025422 [Riccia fluitans]|uniref:Uncharacterized protein n=1 Tax=Riccia fluitans TaxID=41844 RepID=A0ABD1XXQ3_9MARC
MLADEGDRLGVEGAMYSRAGSPHGGCDALVAAVYGRIPDFGLEWYSLQFALAPPIAGRIPVIKAILVGIGSLVTYAGLGGSESSRSAHRGPWDLTQGEPAVTQPQGPR